MRVLRRRLRTERAPLLRLGEVQVNGRALEDGHAVVELEARHAQVGGDFGIRCSRRLVSREDTRVWVAAAYIKSRRYKKILLIGADKMSSIVDYSDRTTCIIFGDGGGAVLFEPNYEGLGWEDEYFRSNGTDRMSLGIKAGGSLYPTSEETLNKGWHIKKKLLLI